MNWSELTNRLQSLCDEHSEGLQLKITYGKQSFSFHELNEVSSASIIKIPLVLAVMKRIQEDALQLEQRCTIDDTVKGAGVLAYLHHAHEFSLHDVMKLAIIVSDNSASNYLIELVGFEAVNDLAQQVGAPSTVLLRNFMSLNRMRDNFTTAHDMVTWLKLIGEPNPYFTEESRRHLYGMLYDQQFNHLLGGQVDEFGDVKIASKSGDNTGIEHDVAIFSVGQHRLYVAVLTQNLPYAAPVISAIGKACADFLRSAAQA
ncbi:serine hydrolase [Kurthia huakuii]|uniref:serine hydrolase n=1 Tax=Kurthia huakuii TaxID=1421019 RepID=UPI0004952CD7|nr:serine hydrolase [Kurthia huakuii]MBM7699123.1 beta-lactamase class A [Kurthia huakuii]